MERCDCEGRVFTLLLKPFVNMVPRASMLAAVRQMRHSLRLLCTCIKAKITDHSTIDVCKGRGPRRRLSALEMPAPVGAAAARACLPLSECRTEELLGWKCRKSGDCELDRFDPTRVLWRSDYGGRFNSDGTRLGRYGAYRSWSFARQKQIDRPVLRGHRPGDWAPSSWECVAGGVPSAGLVDV